MHAYTVSTVCQMQGTRNWVPGANCIVPVAGYQVHSTRCQVPGGGHQVQGTRCRLPGADSFVGI